MNAYYLQIRKLAYITLGAIDNLLGRKPPLITILCYHSINNKGWDFSVRSEEFEKQINYLSEKFDFITLNDLNLFLKSKKNITKPSLIINFDDGYRDILSINNFLKMKGVKPTVFIISDRKRASRKELDTNLEFLNDKEITSLQNSGWEIGCHTKTHADMANLGNTQIKEEIVDSKKDLEKNLKIKIRYIAYPKGLYNQRILKAVESAKYSLGLTMDDGKITKDSNPLTIPRIGVDGTHSFNEFKTLFLPSVSFLRSTLKSFI
jgi:peptidoglycan/xylan/chitin deacetylase (PgdA/CDA1 family)